MVAVQGTLLVLAVFAGTVNWTDAVDRIVGGTAAQINQFPFAAQLLVDERGNGVFVQDCGGTIISNRHVMTASHCFPGVLNTANRWRVRVGSTQRSSGGTIVQVSRLTLHPQFNSGTYNNDIAIVTLQSTLTLSSTVAVATLPAAGTVPRDNQQVTVIGWGLTQYNGQPSENLLQTSVPIVNLVKCRARYATVNMVVTDNMICAGLLGTGGRDACQKDSGGPLIYDNRVHGIVSWGRECGHKDYPGVYTKVSLYLSWITSTMNST